MNKDNDIKSYKLHRHIDELKEKARGEGKKVEGAKCYKCGEELLWQDNQFSICGECAGHYE